LETIIDLPRWAYELAFVSYALVVTGIVLLERRRPTSTLAWLLALIFLPVLGLLLYLLLGRQRVRRRLRRRVRMGFDALAGTRRMASLDVLPAALPGPQRGLVRLALKTAAAPLRRADHVRLLRTAEETWERLASAIAAATRCIHMEFYIWRDDETGRRITALLTDRARQGVKVRVLYDHLGSLGTSSRHFAELREAGGRVAVFGRLRVPFRLRRSRINFRNHRKLITMDGCVGFVGGLNIGSEYLGAEEDPNRWRDLQISMDGDAVVGLEAIFVEDWLASTGEVLDMEGQHPPGAEGVSVRTKGIFRTGVSDDLNPFVPTPETPAQSEGPLVQIIPSGPDLPLMSAIAAQLTAAVASAQHRCWIATPYFVPDESLGLILRTAALRGVDVRVLVPDPRKNDARLVALASRSYYDLMLAAGCRIFEYGGMLHAKYLIVDEHVAAIGSANMDVRSFYINYEVTAMFYNEAVTSDLAAVFESDMERAVEVSIRGRRSIPIQSRLAENFARLLSPLL